MDRRHRLAFRALVVGAVGFAAALIGSYLAGGQTPSEQIGWSGALMIALYLGTPVAFGVAAANVGASDNLVLRVFLAALAAAFAFILLLFFGLSATVKGGGHIHF